MRECLDEGVLQSYCDGELSGARAENVGLHLTQCSSCSALADELMNANDVVLAALAPEFQSAVPTERLRQRIDEAISGLQVAHISRPSSLDRARASFASLGSLFALRPQALGYASLIAVLGFTAIFGLVYFRSNEIPDGGQTVATVTPKNEVVPDKEVKAPAPPRAVNPDGTEINPKPSPTPLGIKSTQRPRPKRHSEVPLNETVAKVQLIPGERSYLKTIAALDSTIKAANDRPMRPELRVEYERNLALVDNALAAARTAAKNNPNDPDAAEFVFAAYQSKVDLLNTVANARVYNRQP